MFTQMRICICLLCVFSTYIDVYSDEVGNTFLLLSSHSGFAADTEYYQDVSKLHCAALSLNRNDSLSFQYNVASNQCGIHVGRFRSAIMPIQDPYLLIYWTYFKNCREDLGYTFYPSDNACVKFHSVKQTWLVANLVCDTEYGHMYLVNSLEKFYLLQTALQAEGITNGFFYLGGTDQFMEGQFSWLDGSTYTKFKGAPNNENGLDHCFGYRAYETGLYDIGCTSQLTFLCEIPLLPML